MKKSTILIYSLLLIIGIDSISIKKTFNTLNTERTLDDYKGTINIEKNVTDEKTTIIITIMHNGEEEIPEKISNLFEKGNEVVMDSLKKIDIGEEKQEEEREENKEKEEEKEREVEQKDVQDVAEEIKDVVAEDKAEGKTPEEIAEDVAEAIAEKAAEVAEQAGKEVTPEEVEEIAETLAEEVKDDLTPKQEEAVQEAVEELPQQVEEKVEQVAEQTTVDLIPLPESGIFEQQQFPEDFSNECEEIGPILSLLKQITSQANSLLDSFKQNPELMSQYTQSSSLSQQQKSNLRTQNSALIEGYKTITNNMLTKLDETIIKVKEIEKESCANQSIQEAQQSLQQVAAFLQLKQ